MDMLDAARGCKLCIVLPALYLMLKSVVDCRRTTAARSPFEFDQVRADVVVCRRGKTIFGAGVNS
jgi:hypothetical protein